MANERKSLQTDADEQVFEEIERYTHLYPQLAAAVRLFGESTEWYQECLDQLYGPRVVLSSSTIAIPTRVAS